MARNKVVRKRAVCHPDKKAHAKGLCRSCYWKNRRSDPEFVRLKKVYAAEHYRRNAAKRSEQVLNRRKQNPESHKAARRLYAKRRRANDINFRLRENLRTRIWNAIKGLCASEGTIELLGCSIQKFREHLESHFREGMTWQNYGLWELDHILPCAMFNLSIEEQRRKCFHFSNLRPSWKKDNQRKSDKLELVA